MVPVRSGRAGSVNPLLILVTQPEMAYVALGRIHVEFLVQCLNSADRKSTRLNSSHLARSRMPSSA